MPFRCRKGLCSCYKIHDEKFQRVGHIKEAGVIIYRRIPETKNEINNRSNATPESFILQNTTSKDIFITDIMAYFDFYKVDCPRCNHIIEKSKSLLRNVSQINKYDIIGICDHCRWKHAKESCQRCKKNTELFITAKDNYKVGFDKLKTWVSKINKLLKDITLREKQINKETNRTVTTHEPGLEELYRDTNSIFFRSSYSVPNITRLKKTRFVDHISLISKSDKYLYRRSETDFKHTLENRSRASEETMHNEPNKSITTDRDIKTQVIEDELSSSIQINDFNHKDLQRDYRINLETPRSGSHDFIFSKSTTDLYDTKQLGVTPMKKYTSDNTLSSTISAIIQDTVKNDFTYYFPKVKNIKTKPVTQISSSELIKDTQDILATRAERERIRLENEQRLKKDEREQKRKAKEMEKISKNEIRSVPKDTFEVEKQMKHVKNFKKETPFSNEFDTSLIARESDITDQETENKSNKKRKNVDKLEKDHIAKEDSKKSKKRSDSKNEELATKKAIKRNNIKSSLEDSDELKKSQYKHKDFKEYDDGQDTSNKVIKERQIKGKPESKPHDIQNTHNTIDEKGKRQTKDKKIVTEKQNITSSLKPDSRLYKDSKKNVQSENNTSAKGGEREPTGKSKVDKFAADEFKMLLSEKAKQKEMEQKQKKIKEEEERKARQAAERKGSELPEVRKKTPTAQAKMESPLVESKPEKKQEIPSTKDLNMAQVKLRKPSIDDTILQLVKIRETNRKVDVKKVLTDKNVKGLILKHKGHSLKNADCLICNDSNIELALDSLDSEGEVDSSICDIIIGEKIFKHKPHLTEVNKEQRKLPILYESLFRDFANDGGKNDEILSEITEDADNKQDLFAKRGHKAVEQEVPKGIIRYALSDRSFIEKGWTMLPTEKVVRKMNVYRMRPAHPEFDWFEHNKSKCLMQYDSGEKLAEFDNNGRGRWFYKNGRVALDYYDAEETNAQQRFVVYSSGEPDERGRSRPFTILATFDYLGNGIVFDHAGKIRLKYNQTEGVLLDRSLGPVSHWKWHALNDPPVLQQVMIDTQMAHKDPDIIKLGGPNEMKKRPDNEEMLAIEFDNFIKEKSKKLTQTFKPFQIKMKALKINEQFSLKVLDQATVYLIFREGSANLKLNLGMILDHKEIVDTDTAEVGEVSNNLERLPACTDSIAELQSGLARAQFTEKLRVERDRRIRPTVPCASADRLVAASSRPLRPPFRTAESTSATTVSCACKYRKPSNNLYYDTRIL